MRPAWGWLGILIVGSFATWTTGLWLVIRWIQKKRTPVFACVLLSIPTWVVFCLPVVWAGANALEEGRWCCRICGTVERRVLCGSWRIWTGSCGDSGAARDGERFESWYWRTIGTPHEHDWMRAGCHFYPVRCAVGCSLSYGQAYLRALPKLPDPEIAIWMVRRVIRATTSERDQLMRPLGLCPHDDLFRSLGDGRRMSRAEFDEAFAQWQGDHPEWR